MNNFLPNPVKTVCSKTVINRGGAIIGDDVLAQVACGYGGTGVIIRMGYRVYETRRPVTYYDETIVVDGRECVGYLGGYDGVPTLPITEDEVRALEAATAEVEAAYDATPDGIAKRQATIDPALHRALFGEDPQS